MKKIKIKNLGPIKHFEMDIKRFNILIGPQAGGKSTIAKALFVLNNVQQELIRYVKNISSEDGKKHLLRNFNKHLKSIFVNTFGNTKYMDNFEIVYYLNNDYIRFYLKDGWVMVYFSDKLKRSIEDLKHEVSILIDINNKLKINPLNDELLSKKLYVEELIDKKINSIFQNDLLLDYIPAGRTLLTVLSEQLGSINISSIDLITKTFIEKIISLKKLFYEDLDSIIEVYKKFTSKKIDFTRVNIAKKIIYSILKGRYKVENAQELILVDGKKSIKINFASSGQQEALWILNLIFYSILYNLNVFYIIEEPEAHIYPVAQKEIVELIVLLGNKNNNTVLITTHSPYILTAFNNLIYAGSLYKKNIHIPFIKREIAIDFKDVNAFMIKGEENYSILDKEISQIKAEEIDSVSKIFNEDFDKMVDLEMRNV